MRTILPALTIGVALGTGVRAAAIDRPSLLDAQRLFFNARYDAAAAVTLELGAADPDDLAACELRTSALLFQLKATIGHQADREKALAQCPECGELLNAFLADTTRCRLVARARVLAAPDDDTALFYLGKLNLNYVWLQLGPLGRKTGWDEYWEARKSLDRVLARNPDFIRARIARAWIDYIVDTRMPWGTRWVLGGGNRKRALAAIKQAANANADEFVHAEAKFALWDLHVRERNLAAAVAIARELARDFPENQDLVRFLKIHEPASPP